MKLLRVAGAVLLVVIVAGGVAGLFYLFGRSTPAAVSLATPTPSATSSSAVPPSATTSSAASTPAASASTSSGSLDGTWSIDSSVGSFSDFSGSFVGYRVQEELVNIGASTAVGRTPDVTGSFTLSGTSITEANFEADLSTLQSDSNMRDGQLTRQGIETGAYPTASFKLTQPIDLGSVPADGQSVNVTATGDLNLHGVTKSVAIPLQARLAGDVVTIVGSVEITFADFQIARPQSMMVLSVADHGTLELQLQFRHS